MPSTLLRRSFLSALVLVVLAGAVLAGMPYLASTRLVRDRIAVELSSWSGFRVQIGAPPRIELWPSFGAVLTDVSFLAWNAPADMPVARAGRVEITLSALAALKGDAVFTGATVINPEFIIEPRPGGYDLPSVATTGRLAAAIDAARVAIRTRPEKPDVSTLPDEPFGVIRIVDGIVKTAKSDQALLSGIAAVVDWSSLNRPGRVSGKAVFNGKEIAFDLQSSSPLLLFAGGETDISASLTSGPATASFSGGAKFGDQPFLTGDVRLETPSIADLATWTRLPIPQEAGSGAATLSGQVMGDRRHLKLDAARIEILGNKGAGALEFGFDRPLAGVSGSLDFDSLDVSSLIDTFAPLANGKGSAAPLVTVDLRLSAARASAGSIALEDIAATVQVKDGLAAFDISDASAFGGSVQAGLRFDGRSATRSVELRLLTSDIDGSALASAAGMKRLMPIGRGTVSVILKGPAETLSAMLERASGSVSASFGPGATSGLNLQELMRRSGSGGFFPLSDMADVNLPVDGLDLEAEISNGVAKIDRGVARMGDRVLRISGIIPYAGRGLALTGTVGPVEGPDEASFFVGGSWDQPVISPRTASSQQE